MSKAVRKLAALGLEFEVGDVFSITLPVPDKRSRWRKLWHRMIRHKPPITYAPQRFEVTNTITGGQAAGKVLPS